MHVTPSLDITLLRLDIIYYGTHATPCTVNREDQPSTSGLGLLKKSVEIPLALHISDSDFDPEEEIELDPGAMTEEFTADWIASS